METAAILWRYLVIKTALRILRAQMTAADHRLARDRQGYPSWTRTRVFDRRRS